MRKFTRYAVVPMAIGSLSACADQMSGPTGPTGNLELNIAPLSLPGITDADYGVTVKNGATPAQVVFSESSLKSTTYGDGKGALTYIGACDADEPIHTIELVVNSVSDNENGAFVTAASNNNPCPSTAPCVATATCSENADVLVQFNLTILREADQGFFDIAVNFADTFCSSKLDCVQNLFPDSTGARTIDAAIIGFACTSGKDSAGNAQNTTLVTEYKVGAEGLDETARGNATTAGGVKYAIYADKEQVDANLNKGFINAAIQIPSAGNITVSGKATAGQGAVSWGAGGSTYVSYPYVDIASTVVPDGCAGVWPQKLDASGSVVQTKYVSADPFGIGAVAQTVNSLE